MTDEKTEEEIIAEETEMMNEGSDAKLGKGDILQVIANALKIGTITSGQAASMRAELGIFGSDFTKKKTSDAARKAKRKAQKKARAVTHNKGYKGQRPPSGRPKMGSSRSK